MKPAEFYVDGRADGWTDGKMDGEADMMKLIVTSYNSANAPKNV
jgi:hypothetical protein